MNSAKFTFLISILERQFPLNSCKIYEQTKHNIKLGQFLLDRTDDKRVKQKSDFN